MALTSCKECGWHVSTEAVSCPRCGAPQKVGTPPALPVHETTVYSDTAVVVTNMRITIGGATYPLRNVTSVKMVFTPPRLVKPVLLLAVGALILFAALVPVTDMPKAPVGVYIIGGGMISAAILWLITAKTRYHVAISSAAGETHALTSENKSYIQRVVASVNEAIIKTH